MASKYNESSLLNHPPTVEGAVEAAPSDMRNFFASNLDNDTIRRHFIRKVFAIVGVQLLFTCGIVCIFTYSPDIRTFLLKTPALSYSAIGLYTFTVLALSCCGEIRRRHPWNLIFLALLTLSLSYLLGVIASSYETSSVLIALGSTVAVTFAIILFVSQTRIDFTLCYGFLLVLSTVLFMFGIFYIFYHDRILQIVYGSLGALLFSIFLAADTQLILANHRYGLTAEDYIF
ncbi:protein lifeguard 1, partial [Hemiscyllium ocellatum]|uniref:protein lifeguard 1 n=1 Tax=Hemiscyllium ocellatum TaxID=170820 RepID=UPI0029672A86